MYLHTYKIIESVFFLLLLHVYLCDILTAENLCYRLSILYIDCGIPCIPLHSTLHLLISFYAVQHIKCFDKFITSTYTRNIHICIMYFSSMQDSNLKMIRNIRNTHFEIKLHIRDCKE